MRLQAGNLRLLLKLVWLLVLLLELLWLLILLLELLWLLELLLLELLLLLLLRGFPGSVVQECLVSLKPDQISLCFQYTLQARNLQDWFWVPEAVLLLGL